MAAGGFDAAGLGDSDVPGELPVAPLVGNEDGGGDGVDDVGVGVGDGDDPVGEGVGLLLIVGGPDVITGGLVGCRVGDAVGEDCFGPGWPGPDAGVVGSTGGTEAGVC